MKIDKQKIAHAFADRLDDYLSGVYGELIDELKVGPQAKEWLRDRVRWTLIDDETGENLLEPSDCAYDGTSKVLVDGRCAACGRNRAQAFRDAESWNKEVAR